MSAVETCQVEPPASEEAASATATAPTLAARADSLVMSLVLMLGLTVAQRLIGFVRNILFCRMLDDQQLGQWSLAYNFLLLAAPLITLGLPGSFARFIEHYRHRMQAWSLVRRIAAFATVTTIVTAALMLGAPASTAKLVFGSGEQAELALWLAFCLITVVMFNFCYELFTALRQVRIVSGLQLVNSILFAVVALALIQFYELGAAAAIIGYAVASLLTGVFGVVVLWRTSRHAVAQHEPLGYRDLWARVVPFAAWLWVIDVLANLFAVADCYMIVHFSGFELSEVQSLLGQYHSSRVVPMLLIGVSLMLSHVVLPHLSHDWENGRRESVGRRLQLSLRAFAWLLTLGAIAVQLAAPLLFHWALGGKYDQGLSVLNWVLLYAVWFSLFGLAHNYLWCAEKGKLGSLALGSGLLVNIVFNLLLVPPLGLLGVVLATAAGAGVALAVTYVICQRLGMPADRPLWLASSLPLLLMLPSWHAASALLLLTWLGLRQQWLLSSAEREQLARLAVQQMSRLPKLSRQPRPVS